MNARDARHVLGAEAYVLAKLPLEMAAGDADAAGHPLDGDGPA